MQSSNVNIKQLLIDFIPVLEKDCEELTGDRRFKAQEILKQARLWKREKENAPELFKEKSICELVKGTLAENVQELKILIMDFNSCLTPDPTDPKTEEALDKVAISIYSGVYSLQDFYDFAEKELGNGYFAKACKEYVTDLLNKGKK